MRFDTNKPIICFWPLSPHFTYILPTITEKAFTDINFVLFSWSIPHFPFRCIHLDALGCLAIFSHAIVWLTIPDMSQTIGHPTPAVICHFPCHYHIFKWQWTPWCFFIESFLLCPQKYIFFSFEKFYLVFRKNTRRFM